MKYLLLASIVVLAGCNAGMAPEGMSREEARAALDRMSPQDQIKYVASSPMPPEQKAKRYAEIEAKTGIKAKDVLGNAPR
ncbi:MAG: hypothetical protein ACO1SV_14965 [Fimbriimonas sp.]